ncbi:MAG: murein biosynthesis integral membrane protein MurJ [bacterium]
MLKNLLNGQSKTITAAAVVIATASLASRFLGVIRERIINSVFTPSQLDCYYAAFQIPNFVYNLLILGTLSAAFIPIFTEYLTKKKEKETSQNLNYIPSDSEPWQITNSVLNLTILIMGLLSFLGFIFTPKLIDFIALGFSPEKKKVTIELARLLMLSPFIFSLSSIFSSVLNATKRFFLVSLAPVLYNLGIIFGAIVLSKKFGLKGLVYGVIIGAILHLSCQLPLIFKIGYRYRFSLNLSHPAIRKIGKLFLPRIFGIDTSQVALLVGSIIGSTLAFGSITILNQVNNLASLVVGVVGISYAMAAFPSLSLLASGADKDSFIKHFSQTFRQILFFVIPSTVILYFLRAQIIRLVLGTQLFNWYNTRLAAACLGLLALSLFSQSLVPLIARAFYAKQDTIRPVLISFATIFINIIFSVLFVRWLEAGFLKDFLGFVLRIGDIMDIRVIGLALAFSLASILNFLFLIYLLWRKLGRLDGRKIYSSISKIFLASAAMAAVIQLMKHLANYLFSVNTFGGVFLQFSLASILGVAVFAYAALWLKSEEMINFYQTLSRKLPWRKIETIEIGK